MYDVVCECEASLTNRSMMRQSEQMSRQARERGQGLRVVLSSDVDSDGLLKSYKQTRHTYTRPLAKGTIKLESCSTTHPCSRAQVTITRYKGCRDGSGRGKRKVLGSPPLPVGIFGCMGGPDR
ncbi:hypothetical protein C8Q74DRAFT_139584 [Fomes fomentarius]|nr:hypothetical protein C8Q74DRAFT_139584 [Fomes fomentarius]